MSIGTLPSPKLNAPSAIQRPRWYRFYAMFSEEFAEQVIERADLAPGSTILDSWLGVGTSASAAVVAGHRVIGVDINPVMVTIARGRLIDHDSGWLEIDRVAKTVKRMGRMQIAQHDPLHLWFGLEAATTLRRWERAIRREAGIETMSDLDCFMMTAIFEAAVKMGATYRSKNPTWLKSPDPSLRVEKCSAEVSSLITQVAKAKVPLCIPALHKAKATLQVGTATCLGIPSSSVDLVLTSPPYCTRIDYAVGTRLELAVLGQGASATRELRDQTMGTSTIRQYATEPNDCWGRECVKFLAAVRRHKSKSSASYYLKTYLQYFSDLFTSLAEINRCLRVNGQAVIVVQDSHYKGIRTDLARIVREMGEHNGWRLLNSYDFEANRNMRRVNTRSRSYCVNVKAIETVLSFSKAE